MYNGNNSTYVRDKQKLVVIIYVKGKEISCTFYLPSTGPYKEGMRIFMSILYSNFIKCFLLEFPINAVLQGTVFAL